VTTEEPESTVGFDPERYWSDRLEQTFSLEGVGWLGLGESFNRWLYAVRRQVFRRAIRGPIDLKAARVLDIGSGTGFYVELWRELGVRDVTGSDLTTVAVERLRDRFPGIRFEKLDISAPHVELDGPYDAISAMDVLFHIVDDNGYAQALQNLAALLGSGGRLIFSEFLLHDATRRGVHETDRSLEQIEDLLLGAGLEVELRRPAFVLMNTPVDSKSGLLRRTWTGVNLLVRRGQRWGNLVGGGLYPIELALTRVLREGPSTEIVVCRKLDAGPT
jgi:SAM-dependent methyltransferase